MIRPIFGLALSLFLLISVYTTANPYYLSVFATPVKSDTPTTINSDGFEYLDENTNGKFDQGEKIISFSGLVYFDGNANGKHDPGEKVMPDVLVYVSDHNSGLDHFVFSSINGTYALHNLNGTGITFYIYAQTPEGYYNTEHPWIDSGIIKTRNFGFALPDSSRMGGVAYLDENANGVRDVSEKGMPGVNITINDFNGEKILQTGADGSYSYKVQSERYGFGPSSDEPQNVYKIRAANLTGYFETQPYKDNRTDGKGSQYNIKDVIKSQDNTTNLNFGYAPNSKLSSSLNGDLVCMNGRALYLPDVCQVISGVAYLDENANGVRDVSEKGMPGVNITIGTLYNGKTIQTRVNGSYSYKVHIQSGDDIYLGAASPSGYFETEAKDKGRHFISSEDILKSQNSTTNLNFGYAPLSKFGSSLSGIAYLDNNANGVMDPGERGLQGINIQLSGPTEDKFVYSYVDETVTSTNGSFSFSDVTPGLAGISADIPDGYLGIEPKSNISNSTYAGVNSLTIYYNEYNISQSKNINDIDFGFLKTAKLKINVVDFSGNAINDTDGYVYFTDEADQKYVFSGSLKDRSSIEFNWIPGHKLKAVVDLGKSHYQIIPNDLIFDLADSENIGTIKLERIQEGKLSGKITNPSGKALKSFVVTAFQNVGNRDWYHTAVTDAEGNYNMSLLEGIARIQGSTSEYIIPENQTVHILANKTVLTNYSTQLMPAYNITTKVYTKYMGGKWEGPFEGKFSFAVTLKATNSFGEALPLNNNNLYNIRAIPGEYIKVCMNGSRVNLPEVCQDIRLADDRNLTAVFRLAEPGLIRGEVVDGITARPILNWHGDLYSLNSTGYRTFVASLSNVSNILYASVPHVGSYQLDISDENDLKFGQLSINVAENEINAGKINLYNQNEFVNVGDNKDNNGLSAIPSEVSPGSTVTFRATYKADGKVNIKNATMILEIPSKTTLVDKSVTLNGSRVDGKKVGSFYEIQLEDLRNGSISGKGTYTVKLDRDFNASGLIGNARINFYDALSGEKHETLLGSAFVTVPGVSIAGPQTLDRLNTTVSGQAPTGSLVQVYDGRAKIGESRSSQGGLWNLDVTLPQTNETLHRLHASVESNVSTINSADLLVLYDPSNPQLIEVCMEQARGEKYCFDPSKGIARFPYVINTNPVLFTVQFTKPKSVSDVSVIYDGPGGGSADATLGNDGIYRASIQPDLSKTMGAIFIKYNLDNSIPRNTSRLFNATEEVLLDDILTGNTTAIQQFLSSENDTARARLNMAPELQNVKFDIIHDLVLSPEPAQRANNTQSGSAANSTALINDKYRGYKLNMTFPKGNVIHKEVKFIPDQIYKPTPIELKTAMAPIYNVKMSVINSSQGFLIDLSYFIPYKALPAAAVKLIDPPTENKHAGVEVHEHLEYPSLGGLATLLPLVGPSIGFKKQLQEIENLRECLMHTDSTHPPEVYEGLWTRLNQARDRAFTEMVVFTSIDLVGGALVVDPSVGAILKEGAIKSGAVKWLGEVISGMVVAKGAEVVANQAVSGGAETQIKRIAEDIELLFPGAAAACEEKKNEKAKHEPEKPYTPIPGNLPGPRGGGDSPRKVADPKHEPEKPYTPIPGNLPGQRGGGDSPRKVAEPKHLPDPSGYVYESVKNNRLQGVRATLIQTNQSGIESLWDAAQYGQINPQETTSEGIYGWDVPYGNYQVVYQKPSYERSTSEEIEVPPPRTDVNVGMISLEPPRVTAVSAVANSSVINNDNNADNAIINSTSGTNSSLSSIFILFSKYILASNVTNATISISEDRTGNDMIGSGANTNVGKKILNGSVIPVNATLDSNGTLLTRQVSFIPSRPIIEGNTYEVHVSHLIQSYSGVQMARDYDTTVTALAKLAYNLTLDSGNNTNAINTTTDKTLIKLIYLDQPISALSSTNDPMSTNTTFTWYGNDSEMSSETVNALNGSTKSTPFFPTDIGLWRVVANFTDGKTVLKSKSVGFNVSEPLNRLVTTVEVTANATENQLANATENQLANATENQLANATENQLANATENQLANATENQLANATENIELSTYVPPESNPGENRLVDEGGQVILNGNSSNDSDGKIVRYLWSQLSGPPIKTTDLDKPIIKFVAPQVSTVTKLRFALTVTDTDNQSDTKPIDIQVRPKIKINRNPVTVDGFVFTNESVTVPITLKATDADGDQLAFSLVSLPQNGTLKQFDLNMGKLRYEPNKGFSGTDIFLFKVNDGTVDSKNYGKITIRIEPVNVTPDLADASTSNNNTSNNSPLTSNQITAIPQQSPPSGFISKGTINSVIIVPAGKWIAVGNWSINVNNGNVTLFQTNTTWYSGDGTAAHTHELVNFRPTSEQLVSLQQATNNIIIKGVTDVRTNDRVVWREVPTTISISGQKIVTILVDDNRTNHHFAGQPMLGVVSSFVSCSDLPGPDLEILPLCNFSTFKENSFSPSNITIAGKPSQVAPKTEGSLPSEVIPSQNSISSQKASNCEKLEIKNIKSSGFESDPADYHPPIDAIDGDSSTWWSNQAKKSWLEIDLGVDNLLCELSIEWNKGDVRKYNFEVSVSNDGNDFKKAFKGTNQVGKSIVEKYKIDEVRGRYIKLAVTSDSSKGWASIKEVSVLGRR